MSPLTILNEKFVPDTRNLLQKLSNQAYGDISANPRKALEVLTEAEYRQLVRNSQFADAQFGNAMERLIARQIRQDSQLQSILVHASPSRHKGQFVRTPDFVGIEGAGFRGFDLTTIGEVPTKLNKPGYGAVEYVIQPGRGSINFR